MKTPWTFEIKYLSAERKLTTGYAVLRKNGEWYGEILAEAAPQIIAALNYYEVELAHTGEPA